MPWGTLHLFGHQAAGHGKHTAPGSATPEVVFGTDLPHYPSPQKTQFTFQGNQTVTSPKVSGTYFGRARCLRLLVLSTKRRASAGLRISGSFFGSFGPGIVKIGSGRPGVAW